MLQIFLRHVGVGSHEGILDRGSGSNHADDGHIDACDSTSRSDDSIAALAMKPSVKSLQSPSPPFMCSLAGKRIRFDDEPTGVHEVTPYSEIYSIHPSRIVSIADGFKRMPPNSDRFRANPSWS